MSRVSDIKLKRTDTTHDLSQKAEKRYPITRLKFSIGFDLTLTIPVK